MGSIFQKAPAETDNSKSHILRDEKLMYSRVLGNDKHLPAGHLVCCGINCNLKYPLLAKDNELKAEINVHQYRRQALQVGA